MIFPLPWNLCRVPRNLASVSSRRTAAEAPPASLGVPPDGPAQIWAAVESLYRTGCHPAIALCIRRHGEVLFDRAIGHARGNGPGESPDAPKMVVTPETPFNVFSAAKAVTAMLVHGLDEANRLRLDDPVCEYIPEFGVEGKELITIRHVLAHRAGIPSVPANVMRLEYLEYPDEVLRILCAAKPETRAGSRLAYHAITGGFLLGEIVRRVTGSTVRSLMQDTVQRPLGLRWMQYGAELADTAQIAHSYLTGPILLPPVSTMMQRALGLPMAEAIASSNDPRFLSALLPSGVLITTADEICQYYQMLLDGGTLRGTQVYAPRTIRRALSEQSYLEPDLTLILPIRYGLGFMLGAPRFSLYGPDTGDAFGHIGFSNVITWADPARQISAALLTSGKPIIYTGLIQLWNLLSTIGEVCGRTTPRTR